MRKVELNSGRPLESLDDWGFVWYGQRTPDGRRTLFSVRDESREQFFRLLLMSSRFGGRRFGCHLDSGSATQRGAAMVLRRCGSCEVMSVVEGERSLEPVKEIALVSEEVAKVKEEGRCG